MADPVVHLTNGIPDSGTGNITTLGAVVAALPAALGAGGGLKIDGSGTALPVSGTITATLGATQNGNLANIDSATSRLTSSATTLLPGTALATTSLVVGSRYHATPPTFTDGQEGALQVDSAGRLLTSSDATIVNANANILALAGGTVAAGTAGAPVVAADQYSTHKEIGAGITAGVLGATGAIGDYLDSVTVYPGIVGCGVVTILDGSTAIGTFAGGGTTALPSCIPFVIPVGAFCTGAGWHITTGASVTVSCKGKFT